jgi:hypothetical protein
MPGIAIIRHPPRVFSPQSLSPSTYQAGILMSTIVKGKNARKPHTVRYWVAGKQREKSFAIRRDADEYRHYIET